MQTDAQNWFSFLLFFLRPNDSPSPLCIKLIEVDNDCADILNRLWLAPQNTWIKEKYSLDQKFFHTGYFICEYHMNSDQCVSSAEINLFSL